MTVTEFALLPLKSRGPLPADLIALLEEAQKTQDAWVQARNPSQPLQTREARGTAMLQQLEDPSVLLITTLWPSPDGHKEWIASPENTSTMKALSPYLDTAGERHVTLFHLDATPLTDFDPTSQTSALLAPVLSVGRFTAREGAKSAFQDAFDAARWVVEDVSKPYPLRGGWRIERKRDTDEFITFCGWESVDQHMSAMQHESWHSWTAAQAHLSTADVRHYKRIV
ncbi:hypothetical protein B0T11DRAFT_109561 [Plectosphaerella cucumerina]|jgi:quinol monooxygenase YgiN|uniref:ABM domain-containing protein n=1 Tax=Plectosphaerella cucumerina TaxID=40658 RepID=A0A8K0THY8_9PEZI|nr:hypothetical protein B0T11DRAFT_109561 [Plectosphaerella cucumerina]